MSVRRLWRRCAARRGVRAAAALAARRGVRASAALAALGALLLGAALPCAPPALRHRSESFPRARAASLAHLLADYSTQPEARGAAWRVLHDSGNDSAWSYRVARDCGARCSEETSVRALSAGAEHRVTLRRRTCRRAPLLARLEACEYAEKEWTVRSAAGGGCVLEERARAWCGGARALLGACARDLLEHSAAHLRTLRRKLGAAGND